MALPEVIKLKNARYHIGYKATQKSMRPDCIQTLFPLWNWCCRKTGHKYWQKKKNEITRLVLFKFLNDLQHLNWDFVFETVLERKVLDIGKYTMLCSKSLKMKAVRVQ